VPAALLHDGAEPAPEALKALAVRDRGVHRAGQVRQQVGVPRGHPEARVDQQRQRARGGLQVLGLLVADADARMGR
jgi:hypothetical protein